MRCRGPRLASPHQVSRLPGLPGANAPPARARKPGLGSGCPAPPTSRSCPRAVPVSNGESISTASSRDRARPAPNLFPAFSASTGCPQKMAGSPHSVMVFPPPFAQVIHRLPGVTWRNAESPASRRVPFRRPFQFDFPNPPGHPRGLSGGIRPVLFGVSRAGSSPGSSRRATMRMINRGRRHWRRRVRLGEGREAWPS